MDHLPRCLPDFCQIKVPYLHDTKKDYVYDNGSRAELPMYPDRHGWSVIQLVRDDGDYTNGGQDTLEQAASMLQAWLYFGLIHVFIGMPVTTSDYIRLTSENERVITMEKLPQHIAAWRRGLLQMSEGQRTSRISDVDEFIAKHVDILYKGCVGWESPVPTEVLFSMIVLRKTLVYAKLSLIPNSVEPAEEWYGETNRFVRTRLIDNGWCPMDAYRLRQKLSSLAQYYVLTLGRHVSARNHSSCTNTRCKAASHIHQRHTECDGRCGFVSPNSSRISSIIRDGNIPMVIYSDIFGLRVQSINKNWATDKGRYVAISHIWADGLGDPNSNAMPRCQLRLLQARVDALYATDTSGTLSPIAF